MEYLIDLPFRCNIDLFDNNSEEEAYMPLTWVLNSIWRSRSNFERDYKILSPQLFEQYSDIVDIIDKLSKIQNIEPDFGVQGNIMQRTNGEYVISDPVKMFVDNMVKLPAIRNKDSITDDIPLSVEKILRIQSPLARSQAIQKYDFTEDEIKQLMSDSKIKAEVQRELQRKYGDRAKQYDHLNDISMDDLEEFMKQFE